MIDFSCVMAGIHVLTQVQLSTCRDIIGWNGWGEKDAAVDDDKSHC